MKIAIFTNNYLPNPYGVTGSVESFRRELERRGHSVYIFAPQYKEYTDPDEKNVFRYPSLDITYKFRFPLPIPGSRKMAQVLKRLDIDIVHSQHPNLLGTAARRWAKKKHVPLVFTWHTLYNRYAHFGPPIAGEWYARHLMQKTARYANGADAVIVPSNSARAIARKWGMDNARTFVVPTGISPTLFANPDKERVRRALHIPKDAKVILTVSRLTNEKNILFLFDAIFSVLRKNKNTYFLCVGGGNLFESLAKRVQKEHLEKRALLVGQVERKELKHYYVAADIFAYASTSETQGLIIGEAMYTGLPVVVVRASGVQDTVMDKVTGVLTSEDEKQFSHALEDMLSDDAKRAQMGLKAKRMAHESMTSEASAERLLKVYKSVV